MQKPNKTIKEIIISNQWIFLLIVIVLLSVTASIVNPRYFTIRNLRNLLSQISVLSLVACGATILIISGNVDISVGANIGLSAVVMAMLIRSGVPVPAAAGMGIVVAILNSLFVGGASILFHAPSFIISLAAISVFQGLALALTGGTIQTIYGEFETLGGSSILGFIPLLFVVAVVGYITVYYVLNYTQLGRYDYAIGDNEKAAYLAGVKIKKTKIIFFLLNGFFVGLAAMLLLSRVGAAQPTTGAGIELKAIGSVVIGGAPMSGGKGNIVGTFFGVLLWGVIGNALNMMQVSPYLQEVTIGLLIVLAVAITSLRLRAEKSYMN
jgi:ribose transport system permease protein